MLQYHADFVSSVTMLLCNYISPILASYFVTCVLRNEREKKKISLLSTLLLPCRDNVNVFILFSHSETQTRASLSLSSSTQLHSRIALTETIYSQLSRNYLENLHLDILILARASSLNFPFPREESEESSMRNEMKNQRECTSVAILSQYRSESRKGENLGKKKKKKKNSNRLPALQTSTSTSPLIPWGNLVFNSSSTLNLRPCALPNEFSPLESTARQSAHRLAKHIIEINGSNLISIRSSRYRSRATTSVPSTPLRATTLGHKRPAATPLPPKPTHLPLSLFHPLTLPSVQSFVHSILLHRRHRHHHHHHHHHHSRNAGKKFLSRGGWQRSHASQVSRSPRVATKTAFSCRESNRSNEFVSTFGHGG